MWNARGQIFGLIISLCGLAIVTIQAQDKFPSLLENYVQKVQTQFAVPGIAVAIVKDGAVILSQGYGIKKMGENNMVDDQTLFAIASNTKAFTATALGILVEEGELE